MLCVSLHALHISNYASILGSEGQGHTLTALVLLCGHAGRNDCVGFLVISVVTESSVCLSELFLANFTTRSLPPFHRSSIAAPTWRCLGYDAADQFCVVDVTTDTFSSVVLDPSKVTAVQLCQFYSQCQSRICVPYNL